MKKGPNTNPQLDDAAGPSSGVDCLVGQIGGSKYRVVVADRHVATVVAIWVYAPRLAVLSNGTVHLKDADQPSAGARHHSTPLRRWGAFFVSMMCRYYRYCMQKYLGVYL